MVLAFAACALAGFLAYRGGILAFAYPKSSHPFGIDVSHHQGQVQWTRLDRSKVAFTYIKASEGGDLRDDAFKANAEGAAQAGMPAGAYHYFTLCRSGAEQADNFLGAIRDAPLKLRPAVDLEYGGNCALRLSPDDFAAELHAFLERLENAGYAPILYVTKPFYDAYLDQPVFAAYPLWLRDLFSPLSTPPGRRVLIWQFANRAQLAGISGPVDRNASMGDLTELMARQ